MAKEWTDEEVKAEIAEAVKIVQSDRLVEGLRGLLGGKNNDSKSKGDPPPGGNPSGDPPKKSGSLWWGNQE